MQILARGRGAGDPARALLRRGERSRARTRRAGQGDVDPAVLDLVRAVGGEHLEPALAPAGDGRRGGAEATTERLGDELRALLREVEIGGVGTPGVGVAVDADGAVAAGGGDEQLLAQAVDATADLVAAIGADTREVHGAAQDEVLGRSA